MNEEMIEFIKDWPCCWKKGNRFSRTSRPKFATTVIEAGYAKAVSKPSKNKMVEKPEKEK